MLNQKELKSLVGHVVSCWQTIGADMYQALAESGETPNFTGEEVLELCIDADRMNPEWAGSAYKGISKQEYDRLIQAFHDENEVAQLAKAIGPYA